MKEISAIDNEVRQAIWFQTDEGYHWDDEEDQENLFIDEEQISEYILRHYILSSSGNWTNKRIRKYLDRDYELD